MLKKAKDPMSPAYVRLFSGALCVLVLSALPTPILIAQEKTLSGPDSHGEVQGLNGHLFGSWHGERSALEERGVDFDFQYVTDSLWNIKSIQQERLASWNRGRGTIDIDFGKLTNLQGLTFHATALWQGGGNLGTYLGTETSPSDMSSYNLFRLDSWWFQQQWFRHRFAARIGQFAGQDSYGTQDYGSSIVYEPMGYALSNLSTTFETGSPGSTPAQELIAAPAHNIYVASMVLAGDRFAFFHNPTGLVPQFAGRQSVFPKLVSHRVIRHMLCALPMMLSAAKDTPGFISLGHPITLAGSLRRRTQPGLETT